MEAEKKEKPENFLFFLLAICKKTENANQPG